MKIKIQENAISRDELMDKLKKNFGDKFKISPRGKGVIVVAKTNLIGAVVLVRKKSLIVNGNFSTMTAQIIFTITLVLLGFLLPLLIYFIFFFGKMKKVEKEVVTFLKAHYREIII